MLKKYYLNGINLNDIQLKDITSISRQLWEDGFMMHLFNVLKIWIISKLLLELNKDLYYQNYSKGTHILLKYLTLLETSKTVNNLIRI